MSLAAPAPGAWTLYGYWRSSASYRVRIALALKGLAYDTVAVDLRAGAQGSGEYRAVNPQGLVPTLATPEGARLTQSLAILDYLDARSPDPRLTPDDPLAAARVRGLAHMVACDIQPVTNLRVLKHVRAAYDLGQEGAEAWFRHWCSLGFDALEARLSTEPETGAFAHGPAPTLADVCLVPQAFNAERFGLTLADWPTLARVVTAARAHSAFAAAAPERQPDAD